MSSGEKSIYVFLKKLDVCKRCILRLLGVSLTDFIYFKNPEKYEEKLELKENLLDNDEKDAKKMKKNCCRVCLNVLTDELLDNAASKIDKIKAAEFTSEQFSITVSLPRTLLIRFHSMRLHLKEKFPDYNLSTTIVHLQKLIKQLLSEKIAAQLNKRFSSQCLLQVGLHFGYEDDDTEVENIKNLDESKFSPKKQKYEAQQTISRNIIPTILERCSEKLFRSNFSVPPTIPSKEIQFVKEEWEAPPLYLGGRYLKFQRNVSQSPWVVEGELLAPLSVTDIIFDAICKHLSYDKSKLTFTASGREDADVRMLGTGRPFYIKVDDVKDRNISQSVFEAIENDIIKDGLVGVINLQVVSRADIGQIKTGEESKTKVYRALCHTTAPDIKEVINMINSMIKSELVITQRTPLRVIHRRAVASRLRTIFRISACKVEGYKDLFEIETETQAGTYVKEFVNGDLGRTVPSLNDLIGHPTDIVALDVIDIKLEWPTSTVKEDK